MANYKVTDTELTSIANAIRMKGGIQAQMIFPDGFVSAIGQLPSSPILGTKTVTANGTYSASTDNLDGYSTFTVNIPSFDSEVF